jgi:hypothetical protein
MGRARPGDVARIECDADYLDTQELLVILAQVVSHIDLDGFLRRMETRPMQASREAPALYRTMDDGQLAADVLVRATRAYQAEVCRLGLPAEDDEPEPPLARERIGGLYRVNKRGWFS